MEAEALEAPGFGVLENDWGILRREGGFPLPLWHPLRDQACLATGCVSGTSLGAAGGSVGVLSALSAPSSMRLLLGLLMT